MTYTRSAGGLSTGQWSALARLVESIPGMEAAVRSYTWSRGPWAQCTALLVWALATGYGGAPK